jgi:hypothetical protein
MTGQPLVQVGSLADVRGGLTVHSSVRQGSMFGLGKFFKKSLGVERHYAPVYVHGEPG